MIDYIKHYPPRLQELVIKIMELTLSSWQLLLSKRPLIGTYLLSKYRVITVIDEKVFDAMLKKKGDKDCLYNALQNVRKKGVQGLFIYFLTPVHLLFIFKT